MKNKMLKIVSILLGIWIVTMPIALAQVSGADTEQEVIKDVSTSLIKWISWLALAISFGVLFFMGMKYAMSGANEKANLKRTFPLYLTGLGIIVLSSTIASFVAVNVAGNEGSDKIYQVGSDAGDRIISALSEQELHYAQFNEAAYQKALEDYNKKVEEAKKRGYSHVVYAPTQENAIVAELLEDGPKTVTYYGPVDVYEEMNGDVKRQYVRAKSATDANGNPQVAWCIRYPDGRISYGDAEESPILREGCYYEPIYGKYDQEKTYGGFATSGIVKVLRNENTAENCITYTNEAGSNPTLFAIDTNGAKEVFVGWNVKKYEIPTFSWETEFDDKFFVESYFDTSAVIEIDTEGWESYDYIVEPIYVRNG